MGKQISKKELNKWADELGLMICEYSPGDGVTRYRFFERDKVPANQKYFGPRNGIYTALGKKEASTFLMGYVRGRK